MHSTVVPPRALTMLTFIKESEDLTKSLGLEKGWGKDYIHHLESYYFIFLCLTSDCLSNFPLNITDLCLSCPGRGLW